MLLQILLLMMLSLLSCHGNNPSTSSSRSNENGQLERVNVRSSRSLVPENPDPYISGDLTTELHATAKSSSSSSSYFSAVNAPIVGEDLTSEYRTKRHVDDPRAKMMSKRGDWSKTNVQMWGKRHVEESSRARPHPLSRKPHGCRTIYGCGKEKIWGKGEVS